MAEAEAIRSKVGTYVGRRITKGNKVAHFWYFEGMKEGESRGYVRNLVVGACIGESYEFTFAEDGSIFIRGDNRPAFLHNTPENKHLTEWIARDQSAAQFGIERRADRIRSKRQTQFDKALQPLRELVESVSNSHADKAALIARITTELWRIN